MKKFILVLAVLMLAAPAFGAAVTITAAQEGSTKEVTISYGTSGQLPRAFALDITVDNGKVIDDVTDFFTGECNDTNGYGIFPASFAREIDADDPNWADVNYTPVADVNDLPGGTEGGKGTPGVTIEMGSLYDASKGKGPPESSGTLCSIWVSGDCNVSFSVNVGRAGVVMEDGNDANSPPHSLVLNGTHVTLEEICIVPDVVGDTNAVAQLTIIAAGFTIGNITTDCNDTIADGNVISTDPAAGEEPGCDTDVNLVISTGPCGCTVPNVLDMDMTDANAAIIAAGLPAGTITYDYNDTEAAREVLAQSPAPGTVIPDCLTPVNLTISAGYCATCKGDISGNGIKNKTDEIQLRGRLNQSMSQTQSFDIRPSSTLWHPCGDMGSGFLMNKTDEIQLRGQLNQSMSQNQTFDVNCP